MTDDFVSNDLLAETLEDYFTETEVNALLDDKVAIATLSNYFT